MTRLMIPRLNYLDYYPRAGQNVGTQQTWYATVFLCATSKNCGGTSFPFEQSPDTLPNLNGDPRGKNVKND